MDEKLNQIEIKLVGMEAKIDDIATSLRKMRRYAFWTMIITVAVIVIPLLILPLVIPAFLNSVTLPTGY